MDMDEQTARRIFETYSSYVFSTALFLTGSRSMADDITQEVFFRVFRSYPSYNTDKPLKPWIYKVVLNVTRTSLRRRTRHQTVPLDFDVPSMDKGIEQDFVEEEYRATLLETLKHISPKSREVIVLRFFENMSFPEISDVLSIPIGTCKSRLGTAMKQLRRTLPNRIAEQYQGGDSLEKA